ncbi:hypothetical protein HJA60_004172 [Vibrio vulnificus]|nr:hypothetical protein [Vibrio vulnificus]MCU8277870.1 hypothetical protein [Vibrio vulnificus]
MNERQFELLKKQLVYLNSSQQKELYHVLKSSKIKENHSGYLSTEEKRFLQEILSN